MQFGFVDRSVNRREECADIGEARPSIRRLGKGTAGLLVRIAMGTPPRSSLCASPESVMNPARKVDPAGATGLEAGKLGLGFSILRSENRISLEAGHPLHAPGSRCPR